MTTIHNANHLISTMERFFQGSRSYDTIERARSRITQAREKLQALRQQLDAISDQQVYTHSDDYGIDAYPILRRTAKKVFIDGGWRWRQQLQLDRQTFEMDGHFYHHRTRQLYYTAAATRAYVEQSIMEIENTIPALQRRAEELECNFFLEGWAVDNSQLRIITRLLPPEVMLYASLVGSHVIDCEDESTMSVVTHNWLEEGF